MKRTCPTCGQSVNKRQIPFYAGMVTALWRVYVWCGERRRHEFAKKEIKHLMGDVASAVFAYWRWFGGLVYNPDGIKGHYGLNMDRCEQFFRGNLEIPIEVWTDPLTHQIEVTQKGKLGQIPKIKDFLDANSNYVAMYKGEPTQLTI